MSRIIPSIAFFLALMRKLPKKRSTCTQCREGSSWRKLQNEETSEREDSRRRLQEEAPGKCSKRRLQENWASWKAVRREDRCSGRRILWENVPGRRSYRRMGSRRIVEVCSERGWKLKDEEKASGVGGRAGSRARKKTLHDKEEEAPREERGGG